MKELPEPWKQLRKEAEDFCRPTNGAQAPFYYDHDRQKFSSCCQVLILDWPNNEKCPGCGQTCDALKGDDYRIQSRDG
jgi:hypothetical protein